MKTTSNQGYESYSFDGQILEHNELSRIIGGDELGNKINAAIITGMLGAVGGGNPLGAPALGLGAGLAVALESQKKDK